MISLAILTVSDKGSRGERPRDLSADAIREVVASLGARVVAYRVVPDEREAIERQLRAWCDAGEADVVVTTGGTGLSPRDVTPEATLAVVERLVPGIAEAMRVAGLAQTPQAMLSRGVVGTRGRTLVLNLPGSPRGVRQSLEAVVAVLPHAVETLRGEVGEHSAPS